MRFAGLRAYEKKKGTDTGVFQTRLAHNCAHTDTDTTSTAAHAHKENELDHVAWFLASQGKHSKAKLSWIWLEDGWDDM